MWFPFALTFALVSSLGVIIAKKIMRETNEYFYLFLGGLFSLPFLLFIVLFFYKIPKVDEVFILAVAASSLMGVLAAVLAYRAIKISDVSLVAPLAAFNPVFTAILAFFFLGELVDFKGWVGIFLVVLGAYLLELPRIKSGFLVPLKGLSMNRGVQYSIAAYFIWAVTPIFEKTAILHTSPQVPPFASLIGMSMSIAIFAVLLSARSKVKNPLRIARKFLLLFLLVGLLGGIGQASAFIAFSLTNLGFATAVFKLSMIFTVFLGWLFLKERNIKERLGGSVVMLSGVFLLAT